MMTHTVALPTGRAAASAAATSSSRLAVAPPVLLLLPPVVARVGPGLLPPVVARAQPTKQIDRIPALETTSSDLDSDMCDVEDLDCQSSLAVETVRKLGRDIQRLAFSSSLFQPDVQYTDGFRSFTGSAKVVKQRFWAESVQGAAVALARMRVIDRTTASVEWRLQGAMGTAGQVDIPVTTTITLNPLTGRITHLKEQWDLSRLPPPAALLVTAQRAAWSLKATTTDAGEGASKALSEGLSSLEGGEDNSQNYYNRDPSDPTKFFQGGGDSQWQDYVSFATLLALVYLVYQAYGELAKLG